MFRRPLVFAALTSLACGPEPSPIVIPPPLHITAKPAPERARWVFANAEQELRSKLDLGDGRTLYVGEHGRRELGKPDELTHATTLALEGLAGVLRDGKRFVFVAADGDTYVSTDPLGTLERAAHPPEPLTAVTTGRASFVGITKNGTVMRSSDAGATWRRVDYALAGDKLVGGAAACVLDGKGNGVLVHLPQRLFITHDDGASWAPLGAPESGATTALRDGADRLFVIGYRQHAAVLDGDKLVATKDSPAPIYTAAAAEALPSLGRSEVDSTRVSRTIIAGDHVVEIALGGDEPSVDIRSARLGEPLPQTWTPHPELVSTGARQTLSRRIATWNGELVYLRPTDPNDGTGEVKPLTTTVMRSKDYGLTWQKEDTLSGTFNGDARVGVDVAIGPRGWMYVGPLCSTQDSHDCKPAVVRPAGKQAFEPITGHDLTPIDVVFDEPRNKVYFLASRDDMKVVAALPLDGATLTLTNMIHSLPATTVALSLDASGTLRAFEGSGSLWTVHRQSAKGELADPVFLSLTGTMAFAGARGLVIGDHEGWETADGGETWTRVPSNGATDRLLCADAGCVLADAQRIGWDLPAFASGDVVRAQATRNPKTTPEQTPPSKTVPSTHVTCKAQGAATPIESVDWMDGATLGRWAQIDTDFVRGSVTLTWGAKDAVHSVPLMSPPPAPKHGDRTQVRTAQEEGDNGMIAARYRFGPRTGRSYSPVDVELAWWSAATGQVHRGTLPHLKPFRVSRFQFSGTARIVDGTSGGLLFQGDDADVVHFIHDDGKVETLAASGIPFNEVWHSGKRWITADSGGGMVALADSEDGGKTWSQRAWGFAQSGSSEATLESIHGSPMLRVRDGLLAVPAPLSDAPLTPTVVSANADERCDAAPTGTLRHSDLVTGPPAVSVDITRGKSPPEILDAYSRVMHDTQSGKSCVSVYSLRMPDSGSGDREAYLYPEKGGGWSGWYRRPADNHGGAVIEPLVCK